MCSTLFEALTALTFSVCASPGQHEVQAPGAIAGSITMPAELPRVTLANKRLRFPRAVVLPGKTVAPVGWAGFCARHHEDCVAPKGEASEITLTRSVFALIQKINRQVNQRVKRADDLVLWDVPEYWEYPKRIKGKLYGDCEDIALEKKRLLKQAGLPVSALRITIVRDERYDGHAVLSVITNEGDLILDNKTDKVRRSDKTGFKFWISRLSADMSHWQKLGGFVRVATKISVR